MCVCVHSFSQFEKYSMFICMYKERCYASSTKVKMYNMYLEGKSLPYEACQAWILLYTRYGELALTFKRQRFSSRVFFCCWNLYPVYLPSYKRMCSMRRQDEFFRCGVLRVESIIFSLLLFLFPFFFVVKYIYFIPSVWCTILHNVVC